MAWQDKVVLITGGSAGLGFAIAEEFGRQGATLAIIGRDSQRLERAVQHLSARGGKARGFVVDVTDETKTRQTITRIAQELGRLDVLVNNVGRSVRADLFKVTLDEYREFMEINFLSAVTCTQAALPALQATSGHVVNIGSLASKTAWPYLAPYSASKFALAAYTHQLRLEGPKNVHYMLVCPGPVKRSDAGERYDGQMGALPEQARRPAAGARIRGLDPAVLAKRIVRGCQRRKREVIPFRARILFAVLAYSPPLGDWLLRRMMNR